MPGDPIDLGFGLWVLSNFLPEEFFIISEDPESKRKREILKNPGKVLQRLNKLATKSYGRNDSYRWRFTGRERKVGQKGNEWTAIIEFVDKEGIVFSRFSTERFFRRKTIAKAYVADEILKYSTFAVAGPFGERLYLNYLDNGRS